MGNVGNEGGDMTALSWIDLSTMTSTDPASSGQADLETDMAKLKLQDLHIVTPLGVGGFGRVILVQEKNNSNETYALKILNKQHIVAIGHQKQVLNEKNMMAELRSDFIVRLHTTFKYDEHLYLLMDPCLEGELLTLLYEVYNPVNRLTAQEIPMHGWFNGFQWEELRDRTMEPPFIPKVESPADTSNFDCESFPEKVDYPHTDNVASWNPDF